MKKIIYLVASLLLMGTTPVLTGCVDNDEPAGIEELRGAKAELLSAKAAVEAAKVATEQANAAYINAQAEYEKARAARELAEAAKLQAKADKTNLEAQAAAAEAAQKLEVAKAEAEQAAKMWEVSYQEAQARYESLLISLKCQQEQKIDNLLREYKTAVSIAKLSLDDKADELKKAQRALDKALATLEDNEAMKELLAYDLKKEVLKAESEKAGAEEALELAKKKAEVAESLQVSDLYNEWKELSEKLTGLNREIADLSVAAANENYQLTLKYEPEIEKLGAEILDIKTVERKVPAFLLSVNGNVPRGLEGTYKSDETVYTYDEPLAYNNRLSSLKTLLDNFEGWVRDDADNDDKWIGEQIGALKDVLEQNTKSYEETKALWVNAVNAFNTNKPNADPSKVEPQYGVLKTDVEAYNAKANAYNAIVDKIAAADKAIQDASKTRSAAENAAAEAKKNADKAAQSAYEETLKSANKDAKDRYKALQNNVKTATENHKKAKEAYEKNPTNQDLLQAYSIAQLNLQNAENALQNTSEAELEQEIRDEAETTRSKAMTDALTEQTKANAAAKKAYDDEEKKQDAIITTEKSNLTAAEKELKNAVKKITDATKGSYVEFKNAIANNKIVYVYITDNSSIVTGSARPDGKGYVKTVKIEELAALNKEELCEAIKRYSNELFGEAVLYDNYIDAYESSTIRLVEVTDEQIHNYVQKKIDEMVHDNTGVNGNIESNLIKKTTYIELYNCFGLKGNMLAGAENIKLLEDYTKNDSDVKALIETVETAIAEMEAEWKAIEDALTVAEDAKKAKENEFNLALKETLLPIEEARSQSAPLRRLINAYVHALSDYKSSYDVLDPEFYTFNEVDLKNYVATCKKEVIEAENTLADAEHELLKAKNNLDNWNSGSVTAYETAKEDLEDAETAYKRAQEAYDAALTELNNKIAQLSVSTAK